jgi:hypothetical protein
MALLEIAFELADWITCRGVDGWVSNCGASRRSTLSGGVKYFPWCTVERSQT